MSDMKLNQHANQTMLVDGEISMTVNMCQINTGSWYRAVILEL